MFGNVGCLDPLKRILVVTYDSTARQAAFSRTRQAVHSNVL